METVFDHNLTPDEIDELGVLDRWINVRHNLVFPEPYTEEGYRATITPGGALFDLGLLYLNRGDEAKAEVYWSQVPDKVAEFKRGMDYQVIEE
ncbi:hypothetical protein GCM10028806_28330 [Spirosoma terrae]|uniref:Uncharacterized protein n=1 Tax=Spirosoma terrae TaxID=1968276 RepID=A0A6L9LCB4_9BACT|nr:hypothetical protein [Spirosoma terrae]NDU97207.1 hypothetical protein [Spirosoma terrae]